MRRHNLDDQPPRKFSEADKSLIRKLHAFMAPKPLLDILNDRLVTDLGEDSNLFSIDQLRAEIESQTNGAVAGGGGDWASLRQLLAKARRDGVLDQVDEQVINDFAIIFSINQKQVLTLKDILLRNEEDES